MLALYDLTTIAMIVTRLASFVMLFAAVLEFQGRALAARISHDYRLHTEQSLWVRLSAHNANPAARRPPLPDSRVLELMREVRAAETAVIIDTSALTIPEAIARAVAVVKAAR